MSQLDAGNGDSKQRRRDKKAGAKMNAMKAKEIDDDQPIMKRAKLGGEEMKTEGSSMVYKSLFDNPKRIMTNDGMDG